MPAQRSAMRKITEVLRLKFETRLSHERIAAATGLSKGAVSNYVQRAVQRSLGWPLGTGISSSGGQGKRGSTWQRSHSELSLGAQLPARPHH